MIKQSWALLGGGAGGLGVVRAVRLVRVFRAGYGSAHSPLKPILIQSFNYLKAYAFQDHGVDRVQLANTPTGVRTRASIADRLWDDASGANAAVDSRLVVVPS